MIRCESVLFIDNDCLVNIFDDLYHADKRILKQVISILAVSYDQIWIPKTIEWEFYLKVGDKKRKKILSWVLENYQFIRRCPIKVSKNEIRELIGITQEDSGEVDAIIQINKTKLLDHYHINKTIFFSQDKGAMKRAKNHDIEVLSYKAFGYKLREIGIILP